MKIGILTFHWGTNYGGVLQAYALQTFLKNKGSEVEIINYAPHTYRDSFFKCFYSINPFIIIDNLKNYRKERNIKKFRNKHLIQSKRYYYPEQLIKNPPLMDVYISGSDQIWNPYGLKSNKKIYFLPFGNKDSIKIAYAASFGVIEYPNNLLEELKPLLNEFKAISVREKSGLDILDKASVSKGILLTDPTLLLEDRDYMRIIDKVKLDKEYDYFLYVLQKKQKIISQIYKSLQKNKKNKIIHSNGINNSVIGIEDWLYHIKNSNFIITNSFHGVVFSIIFNKPFIAVPIEGKLEGMNDRIITLLDRFDLKDRIIWEYDENTIFDLLKIQINWSKTKAVQIQLRLEAQHFFTKNINLI